MSLPLRVVSYGGGVQSTALLVLAARGEIDFPLFLFANVGDDSEHPATLRYVREVALPYATTHGIDLMELCRQRRDGSVETLYGRITKEPNRSISLPMRVGNGGFMRRQCTQDFKIRVVEKELRRRGASRSMPALVAIGISLDELHRAGVDQEAGIQRRCYPLIERRLDRGACATIIRAAGLPLPMGPLLEALSRHNEAILALIPEVASD